MRDRSCPKEHHVEVNLKSILLLGQNGECEVKWAGLSKDQGILDTPNLSRPTFQAQPKVSYNDNRAGSSHSNVNRIDGHNSCRVYGY